ncbi:hypothetical protein [Ideonella sp. BN130291]|uniref:hypothetical protein n=1 Tax=Ideonella sp. BN130291 TaxID=3112940 RepID=UPI002E277061|nr:hypothetical protein [Ideonella sp. BN130291]
MTAAITPVATAAEAAASTGATSSAQAAPAIDPGQARMFARLMGPGGLAAAGFSPAAAPDTLQGAAQALAAQLGGNVRSFEEMRASMLQSIDLSDPIRTMFALTDHAMEAQMTFAKLHISTGLASAATSLFGTLLKNQQ